MLIAAVAPVPPIVVTVPARVAYIFEAVAGFARCVAVAAPALDSAIEVPFRALDTVAAAAPIPRLGISRRTRQAFS